MPKYIGLDLGQATTKIYEKGRGIVLREPTAIAYDTVRGDVIAVGKDARKMYGRTPKDKEAVLPLKGGVIDSFVDTSEVLYSFFVKNGYTGLFNRPKIAVGVPWGISEVERNAFENVCMEAGASGVTHLVAQPMAAALGAGINVLKAKGNLICDIGGGKTQTAVISYRGVLHAGITRVGGCDLDAAIISYIKNTFNVLIGENTAELIKKTAGSAHPMFDKGNFRVYGKDIVTGRATAVSITSAEVRGAMIESFERIVDGIHATLEDMPPRIASDIYDNGMTLCGGTSLLPGIYKLLEQALGMPVRRASRPLDCIVKGIGKIIDSPGELAEVVSRQEMLD